MIVSSCKCKIIGDYDLHGVWVVLCVPKGSRLVYMLATLDK
jgi:hypothetical protein